MAREGSCVRAPAPSPRSDGLTLIGAPCFPLSRVPFSWFPLSRVPFLGARPGQFVLWDSAARVSCSVRRLLHRAVPLPRPPYGMKNPKTGPTTGICEISGRGGSPLSGSRFSLSGLLRALWLATFGLRFSRSHRRLAFFDVEPAFSPLGGIGAVATWDGTSPASARVFSITGAGEFSNEAVSGVSIRLGASAEEATAFTADDLSLVACTSPPTVIHVCSGKIDPSATPTPPQSRTIGAASTRLTRRPATIERSFHSGAASMLMEQPSPQCTTAVEAVGSGHLELPHAALRVQ